MNPKELQNMLEGLRRSMSFDFGPLNRGISNRSIEEAMDDIQERMDRLLYKQEEELQDLKINIFRNPEATFVETNITFETKVRPRRTPENPIPPSNSKSIQPRADKDPDEDPSKRIERIKKQEEEQADKERRSKVPGGFDVWDD